VGINLWIIWSVGTFIFSDIAQIPSNSVALVLGTDLLHSDGSTNSHFITRTVAAAKLYKAGKVNYLLISGNANNRGFNEPIGMKEAIVKLGVPEGKIVVDTVGTRTIDSIINAKQIFALKKLTVVTDDFHMHRALFLCQHFAIEAVGFPAGKSPLDRWAIRSRMREYAARVRSVIDLLFFSSNSLLQTNSTTNYFQ